MNSNEASQETSVPKLMLFIAGNAPRSRRARNNLSEMLKSLDLESVKPLEIDLLSHPEKTLTYSVYATPALICTDEHGGVSVLYGDLSDEPKLRAFVGSVLE